MLPPRKMAFRESLMIQPKGEDQPIAASSPLDFVGPFDWQPQTRVVFGPGTLAQVGELARELESQRPLVVTDLGLRKAGHVEPAMRSLIDAGLNPVLFDGVEENPTTSLVEKAVAFAREHSIDLFIGLGGGSSMDTAKGANFILTNGGKMADYWGVGKASKPMLPLIAIPTTAGTGSEAQSYALISDDKTHVKMACGDKKAAPRIAILDPLVTVSQPARVTAVSGIDAISHALETWVTNVRQPISLMFAARAWKLLADGFPRVLNNPKDVEARGMMLLGAHLAGNAIECSMLGATHSAANPLTAHYDLTHGLAIGILLPHVIRWNAEEVEPQYVELYRIAPGVDHLGQGAGAALALMIENLVERSGLPSTLAECGVPREAIPELSREAASQWTAKFNPRPITARDFESLYHRAYN